jgi:hypothetical protein
MVLYAGIIVLITLPMRVWFNSPTINNAKPEYTVPSVSLFDGIIEIYSDRIKRKLKDYKNWQLKECPKMD